MKVKYFQPDIFEIDSFLENKKIDPTILSVNTMTKAYMHVDRTGLFNPFNLFDLLDLLYILETYFL